MNESEQPVDWSITTWEGSELEQLRRWRQLSLRRKLEALEEMAELARYFNRLRRDGKFRQAT